MDPEHQKLLDEIVELKRDFKNFYDEYQDSGLKNIGWASFSIAVSMILIGTVFLDRNNIALLVLEGILLLIFSFILMLFGGYIDRWFRKK